MKNLPGDRQNGKRTMNRFGYYEYYTWRGSKFLHAIVK